MILKLREHFCLSVGNVPMMCALRGKTKVDSRDNGRKTLTLFLLSRGCEYYRAISRPAYSSDHRYGRVLSRSVNKE